MAFEKEGFCVVRGPDVLWGGDIRCFHPPAGVFDGVIGGDPCQSHSTLANLVRSRGFQPTFPDMTPEYLRIVEEARPVWFLRENVPGAPDIAPRGYSVHSFKLDNAWLDSGDGLGEEQMRKRRFWFGVRDGKAPDLRKWTSFAALQLPMARATILHDGGAWFDDRNRRTRVGTTTHAPISAFDGGSDKRSRRRAIMEPRQVPVALGGSGKPKRTGAHGERYTLTDMLRLQGLPPDFWGPEQKHCPFTVSAARKMIGNGVAMSTGRALARAIKAALAGLEMTRSQA